MTTDATVNSTLNEWFSLASATLFIQVSDGALLLQLSGFLVQPGLRPSRVVTLQRGTDRSVCPTSHHDALAFMTAIKRVLSA